MFKKMITVKRITLKSLSKLLELGFSVKISNPEANIRTPHTNPRLKWEIPKMPKPGLIQKPRNHRVMQMYAKAFKEGKLK